MRKLPVGHPTKDGNLRIAATLSKPLFRRLRRRAAKEGKTMSETVAMLCSIGLLDLDECDRFEPEVNPRPGAQQQQPSA
jgi:hypothetical protein